MAESGQMENGTLEAAVSINGCLSVLMLQVTILQEANCLHANGIWHFQTIVYALYTKCPEGETHEDLKTTLNKQFVVKKLVLVQRTSTTHTLVGKQALTT